MRTILLVAVLCVGCGGEEVPSCQQAVTHFYDVQCAYYDTDTGQEISRLEVIGNCQGIAADAADRCSDQFDDWLICLASVEGQTSAGCDCSTELQALIVCGG